MMRGGCGVNAMVSTRGVLKIFDASCFPLLAEEVLEMVRGGCGVKVTVFDIELR